VTFRQQATIKVDILGFPEAERHCYIEQSLKGQPQSIEKLTCYLKDHLTTNDLFLVPFNIVILLSYLKWVFPFPAILASCTITLFVLPFVNILPSHPVIYSKAL